MAQNHRDTKELAHSLCEGLETKLGIKLWVSVLRPRYVSAMCICKIGTGQSKSRLPQVFSSAAPAQTQVLEFCLLWFALNGIPVGTREQLPEQLFST